MKKKILVIDDNESILDAVSMILQDSGYDVVTDMKADRVTENVLRDKPDLIFLDILLSGQDGREICHSLKNGTETKKIPVVILSAHPSVKKSFTDCGADDFLPKPFEADDLIAMIEKHTR